MVKYLFMRDHVYTTGEMVKYLFRRDHVYIAVEMVNYFLFRTMCICKWQNTQIFIHERP